MQPGDVLVVPNKTFTVMGGIRATGLDSVTIQIDGTLSFKDDLKHWPRHGPGRSADVLECIQLDDPNNVKNILIENLLFKDSPYWTFSAHVDGMEIRN